MWTMILVLNLITCTQIRALGKLYLTDVILEARTVLFAGIE